MTLVAGTRLGSYEVIGPLGAGGMGEVYRAREAKLYSPDPEHLALLDRNTKQSRTVWTAPRGTQIGDFTISKDDTWLCVIQSNDEGDIWLANFQ